MVNSNEIELNNNTNLSSADGNWLSENELSNTNNVEDDDRISKVYSGYNILITGGSGFVGKVLIEKLLRCCDDIGKIYLIMRPKRGKNPDERLKDMFNNVLFDSVKQKRGGEKYLTSKVHVVTGDCSASDLGLTESDRELLKKEANIIYHCAATVRFDSPLVESILLNVRGTKLMIELAKECKNLKYFAYISTAYCHGHIKTLLEKPYPPPHDPHKIIAACEELGDHVINPMTKKILGHVANTYIFTKSLAEGLVSEVLDVIPSAILRPSIIIPVWKEPVPGWTDNINGPTGLLIGAGKGVIRTMYCNSNKCGDFVPVDIVINGIMIATWQYLSAPKFGEPLKVVHISSYKEIRISWQDVVEMGRSVIERKYPFDWVPWYPGGSMKTSKLYHYFCLVLFQWLPALLVDTLLVLLRYPPVLIKVQKRVYHGYEVFEYFANNEWNFDNSKGMELRRSLNNTERIKYVVDRIYVDINKYFEDCTLSARRYILKEKDENLPRARIHMKVMWWVDKICKSLFMYYILKLIYTRLLVPYFQ